MPKTAQGKLRIKAIDNATATLDKIKSKTSKMTRAVKKSTLAFKRQNRQTKNMRKNISKMGGVMTKVGRGLAIGVTAPVVALGAMAIRTSLGFEKGMNKVQALTGATSAQMKEMRNQALDLGRKTVFSASESADAMAFFGQAGFKTNEILQAVPATLDLASASSTGLAESADILSNVMGGFNVKADQAGKFADVLAKTTAKGNTNMIQLGEAMKDGAPVAQQFGASIEETSAFIAKLGDAGIQGSKAGTTLKNMFLNLSAGTSTQRKIMEALNVQTQETDGSMRSMTDILVDMDKAFKLKNVTKANKQAILKEIFGKRAIAGAGVLLNAVNQIDPATGKAVNTIAELTKELEDAKGTAKEMAKTMQKGLPGAFTVLKSSFEGVQLAMLDLKFGGVKLKDMIASIINTISGFFTKLATTHTWLLKLIVVVGVLSALFGVFLLVIGSVILIVPAIITGFSALAVALGVTNVILLGMVASLAILFIKFLLIVAVIALVASAWDDIKEVFSNFLDDPIQSVIDMIGWLQKLMTFGVFDVNDNVDDQLRKQGFKLSGFGENGEDTKADKALKQSSENRKRERNAQLDVNFANIPQGATVTSDDKNGLINTLTGDMSVI